MSEHATTRLTGEVEHDLPILAEAVCLAADAYTDCISEFADTAAGNLRDCCSEHYQALETAVNRWKGCHTVVVMRRRGGAERRGVER